MAPKDYAHSGLAGPVSGLHSDRAGTSSRLGLDMSEPDVGPRPSFLIDMDGVLVHEDDLIPGADRFIKALRQAGLPFLVLTNNSMLAAAGRHRLRRR